MNHQGTKRIETPRLILRPFTTADAEAMYKNWASDKTVTQYLTWPAHGSVQVTGQLLALWEENYARKDYYQWAIVPKDGPDEPIGGMSVVSYNEDLDSAEVGYCIGRLWWNQGLTAEALQAVIDFLFDEVGVNRIEARHDTRNPASGKVMQKCAMQVEGTMRQAARNNQGICDIRQYAILRQDRKERTQ